MIKIIYGVKGSGKTKQLVDYANQAIESAQGDIVYIDKDNSHMLLISRKIRLVNAKDYNIKSADDMLSFIKGMIAGNHDIECFIIDSLTALLNVGLTALKDFYSGIEELERLHNISFVLTASSSESDLPDFIRRYI